MKTYVITGATSGIGNSLVREFSSCNIVFAGYRNVDKRDDLQKISGNIIPFFIDMTFPESIDKAVEFISSKTGKIDTLINAAGCVVAGAVENIEINDRFTFRIIASPPTPLQERGEQDSLTNETGVEII